MTKNINVTSGNGQTNTVLTCHLTLRPPTVIYVPSSYYDNTGYYSVTYDSEVTKVTYETKKYVSGAALFETIIYAK